MRALIVLLFLGYVTTVAVAASRAFTVVVYNVENLFDADGVAKYDEYHPAQYGPQHMAIKLANIAEVLSRFEEGRGADIVLLQEIEVDQTPDAAKRPPADFPVRFAQQSATQLLNGQLDPELAGLSAETWLLKALADRGLTGYTAVAGDDEGLHEGGQPRVVKVVTLSRFPVRAVRQHPIRDARNILEVELEVHGARLYVFNNHWKSGASDPLLEDVRRQNATVLRARVDQILAADPQADIIIGGDFNSQYNQKLRYPEMKHTALNDVLRSQGNELALRGRERDVYNLWFELPVEERGSDTFRGEWGTLMQLLISRGLYDFRGVQYVDNSFGVARFPGVNVDAAGAPVRWQVAGPRASGFSDHLPLFAHFQVVTDDRPDRWLALNRPAQAETLAAPRRVDYGKVDLATAAIRPDAVPEAANLRDGSWNGRLFWVEGEVVPDRHPRVSFRGEEYEVYGVDEATRDRVHEQRRSGRMAFYGELGTFKGRWQFVVRDPRWVGQR